MTVELKKFAGIGAVFATLTATPMMAGRHRRVER